MRVGSARRGDGGMTSIELVVTVAILGVVTVPLLMSLNGAIRIAPEAGARAARAADRGFLANSFAEDTTNGKSVTTPTPDGPATTKPCTETTDEVLNITTNRLNGATLADSQVTYTLTISAPVGTTSAVTITRTEGGVAREVTVGSCQSDDTNVVVVSAATTAGASDLIHTTVDLQLRIRPRANDPIEVVDFKGAFGKTKEPPPA